MAENVPRWPMMIVTYLEVEGCLGAALVSLLGGDMPHLELILLHLKFFGTS